MILTHPHALWLVAAIMALNFLVELTVVRNYTLAVVFITAVALVISTGSRGTDDLGSLLLARGVDTAVGCGVALAVFLLVVPASVTAWLPTAIADTIDAVAATAGHLTPASIITPPGKAARRDLQRSVLQLSQTYDNAINGSARQRRAAEYVWPAVAATQRMAYRTVSECWRVEQLDAAATDEISSQTTHLDELARTARAVATAVRSGVRPPPVAISPGVLSDELAGLRAALEAEPA